MVSLKKEMAVIGAINELLRQRSGDLHINWNILSQYSVMMDARSGLAVMKGFSPETLNAFLNQHKELFALDYSQSKAEDQPTYVFRLAHLLHRDALTLDDIKNLETSVICQVVGEMIDILNPSLNYPLSFLEDMQLIDVLRNR